MEETKHIDWANTSNSKIKHTLVELNYKHAEIKDKIIELSSQLEEIEKEYLMGVKILNERLKGV